MKYILYLIIGLFISVNSANAVGVGDLINGDFNSKSRNDRITISKQIHQLVNELNSYFAEPKPSEKQWVEKERSMINSMPLGKARDIRQIAVFTSPEWYQIRLKNRLNA